MRYINRYLLLVIVCMTAISFVACDNNEPPTPDTPPQEEPTPKPEPEPERPQNYVEYNGEVTELKSMYYIINDTKELGNQYAMAMTTAEGIDSFDAIIEGEEYLFLSLSEQSIVDAVESNDGHIDVLNIDPEDAIYMFIAKLGALDIEDSANNHLNITSAQLLLSIDEHSHDITLEAHYETVIGRVDVVATLPFERPEEPVATNSYLRYSWGDTSVDAAIGSAYAEQTVDGVIYTLCKESIKTYVYYEDSPFLKVEVAGKGIDDDFTIDVSTYDGEFSIWACDPIKGMDLRVSNTKRANCSGVVSLKDGILTCRDLHYAAGGDDVLVNASFVDSYRSVNECVKISYDKRTALFTPHSVLFDNSGDEEYRIYVSSHRGITSVEEMKSADIVITYPKEGWEKWLMKGNFISGSSYPNMTFKYKRSTYTKGEGECYGMNAQIVEYDSQRGHLRLNLNLYTEDGGIALYYSGPYTLVE